MLITLSFLAVTILLVIIINNPVLAIPIGGKADYFDFLGGSLASGDFNGDGRDDLAIGAHGDDFFIEGQGAVNVLYGSTSGLTTLGQQVWYQHTEFLGPAAEENDYFGWSLASGDFNGDGRDDLAIGVPFEDVDHLTDAGAVNILYGSTSGLTTNGFQSWHQASPGIQGFAALLDRFGSSLASGDFNNDGRDDLAIGAPWTTIGDFHSAGEINVLYGSTSGLTSTESDLWNQDSPGIGGVAGLNNNFGSSLASGDFNNDGRDDLAIGVDWENIDNVSLAGAVNVLYGSTSGLTETGDQLWHQDSPGILGIAEYLDTFGSSLTSDDFNNDGRDDLAIGVLRESIGDIGYAGAVNVLYGSTSGLTATGDQSWHQASPGISPVAEQMDFFGGSLASGDFNGDGNYDLAIGVPGEDVDHLTDAGAVNVLYGSTSGLTSIGHQSFHQIVID